MIMKSPIIINAILIFEIINNPNNGNIKAPGTILIMLIILKEVVLVPSFICLLITS